MIKPRQLQNLTVTVESNRSISKCMWKAIFKRQHISLNNFSYHIKESGLEGQLHAGMLNRSLSQRARHCFPFSLKPLFWRAAQFCGSPAQRSRPIMCFSMCCLCVFSSCSTLCIKELFKNALCNSHWVIKPNCHFSFFPHLNQLYISMAVCVLTSLY